MRIKVKAGGIHNLADARYFSTFAEWIGFQLDPAAPYAIGIETAKEFIPWIAGPVIVGELGEMSSEDIGTYVEQLSLKAVQLSEPIDRSKLPASVELVIYEVKVDASMEADLLTRILASMETHVDHFLLNIAADWATLQQEKAGITPSFLRELAEQYSIILQLAFSPTSIIPIIEGVSPFAINLTGGIEEKVGLRSFEELDAIVEALY